MAHHSCICCCAYDNVQAKNISGKAGFFKEYWRILLSPVILFSGITLSMANTEFFRNGTVTLVWYSLAYLPVGLSVLKETWESILQKDIFSESILMSIATLGASYVREYPEGVTVMLLYPLGELSQDKAISGAKRNIDALLDVRPETAAVIRDDVAVTETPRNVQVGEIVEVKTGERISLDGKVLGEAASLNTSALTGRNALRTIRKGEEVFAGMIAIGKVVRVEATKPSEKNALSRTLELVQDVSEHKVPTELSIRKLVRIYTSVVTGLTLLIVLLPFLHSLMNVQSILVFNNWLYRALVFLVISYLRTLVVSIPLRYFGGIDATSRLGILLKGGNYLDAIVGISMVVFDKTDTLTQGTFEVQSCHTRPGILEEKLAQTIVSTERNSMHPVAKAITSYVGQRQIPLVSATDITGIASHGLEAMIDGQYVPVGNTRLLSKYEVEYPQELFEIADTIVVCVINSTYVGYLLLSDTLKADTYKAIKDLKVLNINNIQILSDDKQAIVTNFAQKLGVTQAHGDLLPDGKVEHIEELRQDADNRIALVGDGINDAPVLALNYVRIIMGGLGSDVTIETADVVIQTDQPPGVATATRVGKQTHRVVQQNILLTFGVKLSVLILGAGGLAALWEAVFADVGVAPIVIVNAIRVQKLIK